MPRTKLTTEKIIENCKKKYNDKYDYSLIEASTTYKIKIICPIHGVFETNYFDFIKGHACPKCSIENVRLREEKKFKEKMNLLNGNKIIYPDDFYYLNSYTKVNIIFNGQLISREPHSLMKKKLLTIEDKLNKIKSRGISKSLNRWSNIEEELKEKNPKIIEFKKEQIDFIKNGKADRNFLIDIKCNKHGWVKQNFYELRNGFGCPKCFYKKTSVSEKEILNFIKSIYNKEIIENDRTILKGKELDIYIPNLKIAIEYDGIYWHNNVDNYYKYEMCKEKDIRLIQITEYEWINEKEKIKCYLKSIFGNKKNFITIGARKCYIKEINLSDYKDFCNKYHLQGYSHSSVKIGLFYKNELVEVEGFSKARFGDYEWELIRECSKTNYFIYGGKSKMLNFFEKKYKPKNLVSYCEKNKFSGKSYLACGFKLLKESHQGYSYYKNNKKFSRMTFQKCKLKDIFENFNPDLTEWENMKNNGYLKLFDYGNFVFIKTY